MIDLDFIFIGLGIIFIMALTFAVYFPVFWLLVIGVSICGGLLFVFLGTFLLERRLN